MEKSILFICESGISASLFVSKMLESLRDHGLNYDVDYAPVQRVETKLSQQHYDVILLAPQIKRYEKELRSLLEEKSHESYVSGIQDDEFITMNIERILERIK
ncbi:PTS cellobiose transporter subunit IIC [Vagococcus sp. JNUCC 83]